MPVMRDCKNERCIYHDESYSMCSCEKIEIGSDGECLDCYVLEELEVEKEDKMKKLNTIQKRENLNNIYAVDKKGSGGAHHRFVTVPVGEIEPVAEIQFQNGARKDTDSIQGVLDADLLEIVRDRLQGFQQGEFATRYNAIALTHIEEALMWLNRRVEDRIERDVLGTYKN